MSDAQTDPIAVRLAGYSTSLLSDAMGGKGVVAPGLVRYAGTSTVAGRAVTAQCAEGSVQANMAALEHARPGDILCVVGPGNSAYLGDQLAGNLIRKRLVGAVIDGFIRDRVAIADMPLTIHARGLCPANPRRPEPGAAMVPITIGGVVVSPGDWVVADEDGVIVIAAEDVDRALTQAHANTLIEQRMHELMAGGMSMRDAARQAVAEIRTAD